MFIPHRIFFTDGANEGGGGAGAGEGNNAAAAGANEGEGGNKNEGAGAGEGNDAAAASADGKVIPQAFFSADELKELGLDNEGQAKDRLRQLLAKEKELNTPDEEKLKKENLTKAEFLKYSADNNLLKVEDYNKYESLKQKADRDLVFDGYLKSWKEENPHIAADEVDRLAKEDFEAEYKLDSSNEKTKARGLEKLKREAGELRSPYEKSYQDAYGKFTNAKQVEAKVPEFNKFIDDVVKDAIPDKLQVLKTKEGEQEIEVDVDLTDDQKKEINKTFRNHKVFGQFFNAKPEELKDLKASIQKKIEGFIKINNFEAAVQKGYDTGKGLGVKQGSNTGANNPFALKDANGKPKDTKVVSIEDSNAKIAAARARYANQ